MVQVATAQMTQAEARTAAAETALREASEKREQQEEIR